MRYISVFSGIEAASVAWEPLGWEPLAFCEIDEFPSAVLAHRFTDVENLGDITKADWKEVIARHGRPDVVVGGSPCQSFSVAGGRESLSGESRLMFEYIRALDEIRPRWFLWENVPGVLNTRDNAFAQLLGEVQKLGYGSLAWRVLDAQFFGVAQRRRRVFLVGRIGEGGSAAAVLFEPESVRGDNPTSREKREALARAAGRGPAAGGGEGMNTQPSILQSAGFCGYASHTASSIGYQEELSPTLKGNDWQCQVPDVLQATAIRTANTGANGCGISEGCAHTLDRAQPEAVCIQGSMIGRADENGPQGGGVNEDVAFTLDCTDRHAVCFAQNTRDEVRLQGGDGSVAGALGASGSAKGQGVPFVMATGQANAEVTEDIAPTLNCAHEQPIVVDRAAFNQGANGDGYAIMDDSSLPREKDMSSGTVRGLRQGGEDGRSPQERQLAGQLARELDSGMSELPPKAARRNEEEQKSSTAETGQGKYVIRRLTPTECERLQGFPDGWTDVPYKGKEHPSDTPRYKALGNSMAVPVMRWIGERIQMVDKMEVGA